MARMRHFLKRCPAVLLSAALLAAAVGTAAAADTPAPTLGIYTTGDMGGRLYREDPVTGEAVEYSYQNVASAMEAERASVDAALLLDSGDAVDNGLVLDGGAAEALGDVVRGVAAGKKAVISGFHDVTGDPAKNEELAKQRALRVRDALTALGIGEDKLDLRKPAVTTADGSNAEARRVEVTLE